MYLATVLPGLEFVAMNEIAYKIQDADIRKMHRGKVLFSTSQPLEALYDLRSIDNLYLFIDQFTMGPHRQHLSDLEHTISELDLDSKTILEMTNQHPKRLRFVVNASRSGKHTYSRFDVSDAATQGISRQFPHWKVGTPKEHTLEFRLDLNDDQVLFSVRLTPATFRFRGHSRSFSQAALRPTVAHALVWLSNPQEDEVFLDPFCGSGTIMAERAYYPAKAIMGGDKEREAINIAKENVPTSSHILISQWDARRLPVDENSIHTIVTNLPFGRQILSQSEITGLYRQSIQEMERILYPNGQAFILTDQMDALQNALVETDFQMQTIAQISLKGLRPTIIQLNT